MRWDPCWLAEREPPLWLRTPEDTALWELSREEPGCAVEPVAEMGDAYELLAQGGGLVRGGGTGVLYGAHRLLRCRRLGLPLPRGVQKPVHALRMLNHWDNLDGTVERGYAGRSLFFEGGDLCYDPARIRAYARLLASVGVNGLCLNNVNVISPAQELLGERLLPRVAELAALFAPFGVRLMLAVGFSMPLQCGLPTADPLNAAVAAWWRERAALVYRHVPSLLGFLVKADSENRPGPHAYGRNHAQGANMLAQALRPHGGVLVWRCFVYDCRQDWRDRRTDRPMAAYRSFAGLDGAFAENVILQIKHGPFDFQVREPVSPLLLAMPRTAKAMELQLAQEYTGQQIDLYAMQGMWNEVFAQLPGSGLRAVAAVVNAGRDACWTGHPFAQLNLFAYGLTAWQPGQLFAEVTRQWAALTYGLQGEALATLADMLTGSREVYERYTAPLGLCWMVNPGHHYGPSPMGYEYTAWGTYHRADREAVGIDRTAEGTGYLLQYPPRLQALYRNPATCPDALLLFFHRLPYAYRMRDGRTLIQRIYDDHFLGAAQAQALQSSLSTLRGALPEAAYRAAAERMERQVQNAREWRDVLCDFFFRLSGVEDEQHRL